VHTFGCRCGGSCRSSLRVSVIGLARSFRINDSDRTVSVANSKSLNSRSIFLSILLVSLLESPAVKGR
jgi:hypothetical protein